MPVATFDVNAFVYNTSLNIPPSGTSSTVSMTNSDAAINKLYYSTLSSDITDDKNADGRFNVGETVTLTDYKASNQAVQNSTMKLTVLGSGTFTWKSALIPNFGGTADVLVTSDGTKTYLVFVNGTQKSHAANNLDKSGASGPRFGEDILKSTLTWQTVGYEPGKGPLCFCRGTMIATERGNIKIEDLQAGDKVSTRDNGFQVIRWIGAMTITPTRLASNPKLRPIRITSGSLGAGLPAQDLLVSPQHRIIIRSQISKHMFGAEEILVPAVKLIGMPGIFIDESIDEVEYFHMLFDQHEIVTSNGAETESLYTGPMALRSLSPAARAEIFSIFPELEQISTERELARFAPKGKKISALVSRHMKNAKPLQALALN